MKYGAMNFPLKSTVEEMEEIGKLDFDFVELAMDPPEATSEELLKRKKEILDVLSAYDMGIVAHLPIFPNISSPYQSIREASIGEYLNALEVAAELGVRKAVLHPSFMPGLRGPVKEGVGAHMGQGLDAILKKALELDITICLENLFPPPMAHTLSSPEEFAEVLAEYPVLKLALDIGHANIGTDKNRALEFVKLLGSRIGHIHAGDNFGKEDNHLPIGAGTVDFSKILEELKGTGYDDTLTLEVFSRDRDYLRISRDKIRELWER
jgi:sugar phosphate isomerase/epimerase